MSQLNAAEPAKSPQLVDIIQSPLAQLIEWQRNVTGAATSDQSIYMEAIISYLKSDTVALKRAADQLNNLDSPFVFLAELRLKIRTHNLSESEIQAFISSLDPSQSPAYLGEAHFIAGYAAYTIRSFDLALKCYEPARIFLRAAGALKKSLKTSQNILATKTCIDRELKCIPEYYAIYVEARRLRDYSSSGLALLNISREYQKIGALTVALKTIEQGILFFTKEIGTLHYYLALVHRAHIFLQLNIQDKAMADIEKCLASDFREVHQAVAVLEKIDLQASSIEIQPSLLNPTWRDRAARGARELNAEVVFHDNEQKLLSILRRGSKTKIQLIEDMFGSKIDFESAENRFRNLLVRIRRKSPELISLIDGRYAISDRKMRGA